MMQAQLFKFSALIAAMMALVACGGGGGGDSASVVGPTTSSPPAASSAGTPEGTYRGIFSGGSSRDFQMLVLENNDIWALYGTQSAAAFTVAGFIQATGTAAGGNYSSTAATNFPASASPVNGSVIATYNATAKTITGSATAPAATPIIFSGGAIAGSTYNYDAPAVLSSVTGSWSLTAVTGESIALNVGSTGVFTASSGLGCNFSGTVTPRASGKNVFNVSLTFGAAPCALPGQSANGIAINYPVTGGRNQLVVSVLNATRNAGIAVFGTR